MYSLLITLGIVVSVLLIIIVLLQASKGEGLAGITGGAPGSFGTVFGARRTADFLSKATWWLGGILFVLAIVTNLFFLPGQKTNAQLNSIIQSSRSSVPITPALPLTKPVKRNNTKNQTGTIPKK